MAGPGLAEINAFVAIAEQRSFTKAALRLGISVSTLSGNLRRLEDRLGVRLIERSTRSVAASEAGERLLARLRPLLDDYEDAFESISEFRNKPSGRLQITVGAPGAHTVMDPIAALFLTRHPEVRLELSVDDAFSRPLPTARAFKRTTKWGQSREWHGPTPKVGFVRRD